MVLDRDPNAVYRILEVPDTLTYNDSVIVLNTSANGLEVFRNINSLLVESPFELRQYFRIAPGLFSGYGRFMKLLVMISVSTALFFTMQHNLLYLAMKLSWSNLE